MPDIYNHIPFDHRNPPWRTARKPWKRSLCEWRYVYSFIEGGDITVAELAKESGMSAPSLARWSAADKWTSQRESLDIHFDGTALEQIRAEANGAPVEDKKIVPLDPETLAAREEILERINSIADKHVDTIHAAVEVQKKHILAYKQGRELGVMFNTCFIHILTRMSAGAPPDPKIQRTFEEMMRRGGNAAIKVYSDMLDRAIAGEERIYGLNQMRDLRAAEATLASAGYAIVEAKALQETKQLEAGEIEGEILEEKA